MEMRKSSTKMFKGVDEKNIGVGQRNFPFCTPSESQVE